LTQLARRKDPARQPAEALLLLGLGDIGTVHFKSTDATALLPANYTFTAADKGVHTFVGLVLRKRGTQTITITDTLHSALTASVIENVM
jgi:hypothetical protein